MHKQAVVITTIQMPTKGVSQIAERLGQKFNIVVIGDKKSPPGFLEQNVNYYNIEAQQNIDSKLAKIIPYNHYARKNIGYIIAMQNEAELILETDDDNIPYPNFGTNLRREVEGTLISAKGWFNSYQEFSSETIWPRGFPLEQIHQKKPVHQTNATKECCIQQFLADDNPDVDAIYRLAQPSQKITFEQRKPIILEQGTFCPFNSQNTVTFKEAFPLLYLPSFVSFRMTDIWRSFVSQVIMQSLGWSLSFHSATVYQERNLHNLIKDFELEIPGYLKNQLIMDILNSISFAGSLENRLYQAYETLIKKGILDEQEMKLVENWLKDLD